MGVFDDLRKKEGKPPLEKTVSFNPDIVLKGTAREGYI